MHADKTKDQCPSILNAVLSSELAFDSNLSFRVIFSFAPESHESSWQ